MRTLSFLLLALLIGSTQSCKNTTPAGHETEVVMSDAEFLNTLREAYLFGFPLVVMDASRKTMTNVADVTSGSVMRAPINQFVHARQFPNAESRDVVRPNADTYYSSAWLDLRAEPMVLTLPNTNGRYYLFPMMDAWTNIFFSPGSRTTGTDAQTYLLTAPGWSGAIPENMTEVKAPTSMVWIIGRIQVNSPEDAATIVKAIQDGIGLMPLSSLGKDYTPPAGAVDPALPAQTPNDMVMGMEPTDFFNRLNQLMRDNPPAPADSIILRKLAPLGIGPDSTFDATRLPATVQDSLPGIAALAKQTMLATGLGSGNPVNGWMVNTGLGTYSTQYSFRAGVAFGGLGANLDADAMYPAGMVDADGEPFDGSKHSYTLTFPKDMTPPANAFWSLTLYDDEGFMVANPINRFAIGDRNALKPNANGSIEILISHQDPGKDRRANWLPAPAGPFNLLMRVYWPKPAMLDGTWMPPGVQKVRE